MVAEKFKREGRYRYSSFNMGAVCLEMTGQDYDICYRARATVQ